MTVDDATPARLPRAERRQQLLESAREVFAARGFHAASMDEIAISAGVSKPVLYQHFPSKVDLYLALLDSEAGNLVTAVRDALRSTRDNRERVTGAIKAYFSLADGVVGHRLLFEPEMSADGAVRQRVEAMEHECARLIAAVISEDTGASPSDALILASGLCGMAEVGAQAWLRNGRPVPVDQAVAAVSRLAWKGISGFPRVGT